MKKWFLSLLFGARTEATPSPQPAAPVYSADDRKLDLIWSRFAKLVFPTSSQKYFQTLPPPPLFRREDHPEITADWPDLLAGHRFLLVALPPKYERNEDDICHGYEQKRMRYPLRLDVQDAGGFTAYCLSDAFALTIRDEVERWQYNALLWNRDQPDDPRHDEAAILNPPIEVHLLDPEAAELVKVRIPRWPFPPPSLPPLAPAKLISPQPCPGIGKALSVPKEKVKKLSR
jgi:hypothetical protein